MELSYLALYSSSEKDFSSFGDVGLVRFNPFCEERREEERRRKATIHCYKEGLRRYYKTLFGFEEILRLEKECREEERRKEKRRREIFCEEIRREVLRREELRRHEELCREEFRRAIIFLTAGKSKQLFSPPNEKVDLFSDVYTNDTNKRWENGLVPFEFDNNMTSDLKGFVMEAIRRIESVCPVFFKKRTNQANYIRFICGDRFASHVGMIGGEQKLYVTNKYPDPVGSAMHELMHALGFYHEHCRPDRDEYLEVRNQVSININYKKLAESDVSCFGPYDPHSIMHYPLNALMRLRSGVKVDFRMGQRIELSEGDINALNKVYFPNSILYRELKKEYERSERKIEKLKEHSQHLRRVMRQHDRYRPY